MSYTVRDLDTEISAKVEWIENNNGAEIHKSWLIQAIMGDHHDVYGEDADFALFGARETVQQRIDRYFRTVKAGEEDPNSDPQLVLPGYEYLQKRYIVKRNEESVMVRVQAMTSEEIALKASEHRRMGDGHFKHADELERFAQERVVAA